MSRRVTWEGVFPAVTTQFHDDLSLDIDATAKVMDGLIRDGVSGRVWQSLPAADRELITKTIKTTLDAQIDELAGNEPALIENFKNAPIPIRQVPAGDTEAVIAEFDKIWLPKAPVLAELRKVGATL